MGVTGDRFAAEYAAAFRQYLAGGAERSLETAYELGRLAVTERVSLMDLAEAHHAALGAILAEGGTNGITTSAAADFFRESLATFEIAARAFHGAHETVRVEQAHAATQHALAETAVALNERLDPAHILRVGAERARVITGASAAVAQMRPEGSSETLRVAVGDTDTGGEAVNAPLVGRDRRVVGWLGVYDVSAPEHSQPIITQIAEMASAAIGNAQRYQHERYVAETLQRSLLPAALPDLPGLDAAAAYWPAANGVQVGGDFYDVFRAAGDWTVVIGDVCGKGPAAASLTALARYTLRAASLHERSPSAVLRLLNAAMLEETTDGRFATVVCAYIRPGEGATSLTLANGGHPLPLILRADGGVESVGAGGMLLGVVEDPSLADVETRLERGDLLLLYTDGAVEVRAQHRVVFGREELESLLRDCRGAGATEVLDAIRAAHDRVSGRSLRDDVALLALRVRD
jgi:serine phosphatase RsbU (regulator of sigma subunit)